MESSINSTPLRKISMRIKMKRWNTLVTLLLSMGIATTAVAENNKWDPWFEFGGYYGTDNASRG
ncbi:MAG: hypothetical protein GY784_16185, partial [Gammaproteobacteria bacterium]|nr:hypothetical protein [Gammaproteobacteria bacterium]